jgi:hypothetical protein
VKIKMLIGLPDLRSSLSSAEVANITRKPLDHRSYFSLPKQFTFQAGCASLSPGIASSAARVPVLTFTSVPRS